MVAGNYFQVLGIQPALGRLIAPDDDRTPGGHPVAVLSHAYWQRRFAGDPAIVGRELTINNTPMTVIGVAPPGFIGSFLGVATAAWVPMAMQAQMTGSSRLEARGSSWMQALARLKPGVSRAQAQSELTTIMDGLGREYPANNDGLRVRVVRSWEAQFGAPSVLAPILAVLSVVVALVLLIACANVANLLLSRAVGRRREVAIRLSLGASRWRLVRQLLTEAMLLALVAGAAGIVMAYWTSGVLMAFAPPTDMPIDFGLRVDAQTLGYALGVSLLTGVCLRSRARAAGLEPEHRARVEGGSRPRRNRRADRAPAARGPGRGAGGDLRRAAGRRDALCALADRRAGPEPRIRAARDADRVDRFGPERLHRRYGPPVPSPAGRERRRPCPASSRRRWGATCRSGSAARARWASTIDGYTPRPNEEMTIIYNIVGAALLRDDADSAGARPRVHRRRTRASARARADRQRDDGAAGTGAAARRVGGTGADRQGRLSGRRRRQGHQVPPDRRAAASRSCICRSSRTSRARSCCTCAAPARRARCWRSVRSAIRTLDPNLPIFDARTIEEHMQTAVFAQRMGANMLGAMGVLALLLAAVGLYGVIAYAVSQRTQEMGVRLALGAAPGHLLRMIVGQGVKLTLIGLAIGVALAFGAAGFLATLLPGVAPRDPVTFVAVPLALLTIALIAAWIPARRAGAVDPVVALGTNRADACVDAQACVAGPVRRPALTEPFRELDDRQRRRSFRLVVDQHVDALLALQRARARPRRHPARIASSGSTRRLNGRKASR